MSRDFNTPHRCDWNAKIHNILKTIDLHTELYLKTDNPFHEEQAKILRQYVSDLKTWIHSCEK
jgi:hypothetical protein